LFARAEGQTPDGMVVRDAVSFQSLVLRSSLRAELRQGLVAVVNMFAFWHMLPWANRFPDPLCLSPKPPRNF